ncbi:MAG: hypothetical protein AAB368_15770, partial [bacterium]
PHVVQYVVVPTITPDKAVYAAGEAVTYTLRMTNTGTGVINKMILSCVLPPGAVRVPGSCTGPPGVPCQDSLSGGGEPIVFWNSPGLAPWATMPFTFKMVPPAPSCTPAVFSSTMSVDVQEGCPETFRY